MLLNAATAVYAGAIPAQKVYMGDTLVWSAVSWLPPTIPGLFLALDATQITGVADGSLLQTWPDMSGNGFTVNAETQTITYQAAAINGQPAVRFGVSGPAMMKTLHDARPIGDRTIFLVIQTLTAVGAGGYHSIQHQEALPHMQTYGPDNIRTYTNPAELNSGRPWTSVCQFITLWSDAAVPQHWLEVDGYRVAGAYQPNTSPTPFYIGGWVPGGYGLNGYIGELLVYERCLTDTERAEVQQYLNQKWSTP